MYTNVQLPSVEFKTPPVHDASMPVTQGGRSRVLDPHPFVGRFFIRPSHQASGENVKSTHWKHNEVVKMYCRLCKVDLTDDEIIAFLKEGLEEQ